MSNYAALLDSMMNALLTDDTTAARSLYPDKKDFSAEEQLSVYVHGYRIRMHKVIKNLYTATHYYLGKDVFQKLVNDYITSTPSHYFNIDKYALEFADYVALTSDDIFACELADLESMLREIYHKPETPPLDKGWLERQTPDSLTNTPLYLRAASRLLVFAYPVSDYITAFRADENPVKPMETMTYLMVLRDSDHMQRVPLEEAEYVLLTLVDEGLTLGAALASEGFAPFAGNEHLAEDFQHWFLRWVNEGFFRITI